MKRAVLVLDTSVAGVAMALTAVDADGGGAGSTPGAGSGLLWSDRHLDNAGSVPAISVLFAAGLRATGVERRDLAGVVVSVGPGSFTGIKIGLAFAYGLRSAWPAPLLMLGLSGLEAAVLAAARVGGLDLASPGPAAPDLASVAADLGGRVPQGLFLPATRTHGFFAGRKGDGTAVSELVDVESADFAAMWQRYWPEQASLAPTLAVTGPWPLLQDRLAQRGHEVQVVAPSTVSHLAIHGMSRKGAEVWPHGFGEDPPQPRYLRLSTAEERLAHHAAVAATQGSAPGSGSVPTPGR